MKSTNSLTGSHLRTYERIFQHPISHNLEWRDVRTLLGKLGQVEEESNGNLKVTRNGQSLVIHPSSTKDVAEMDELMTLRHFLERSDTPLPESIGNETHWLLVIDHHEARIFHCEMEGAIPQRILPHVPEDYFRHAHNSKEQSRGREKPNPNDYFEPVARALHAPGPILIFGTGTGTSNEMDQFVGWLKGHYQDLANRVIGTQTIDESHLTEGQLLAKARAFFEKNSKIMITPILDRDLTNQAPHSPRNRIAGFAIASRAIDKCHASLAGKLGDYHYDCPLDNVLFTFKGITGDQFKAAVQTSPNYEEIGAWLLANGLPKSAGEIKAWSDEIEAGSLMKNPEKRHFFIENCAKVGLDPETSTTFDWLEADDRASFSSSPSPK